MSLLSTGAKTACWQNEDLFCDGVDLSHAFVVVDHWHHGLAHSQRNRTGYKNSIIDKNACEEIAINPNASNIQVICGDGILLNVNPEFENEINNNLIS